MKLLYRSKIAGLSLVLKFGINYNIFSSHTISSFGDIVIFIFCRWKLPIHALFSGVLGAYFSHIWSQGVEFPFFLLIFAWALQHCSANALPVILCRGVLLFSLAPSLLCFASFYYKCKKTSVL